MDPTATAIGTWSGGRFMRFGEEIAPERMRALLRPCEGLRTVISADAYGLGEADRALGEALRGVDRDSYCLVGAVGHDFYAGRRDGAKGFPRFTDPRLRGPNDYAPYLKNATERSLERCGAERFDLLLLHNPDHTGYHSEAVWAGMEALRDAGLTRMLGVAPGPANGFTLDLIACLERFGELIDWAMIIYGPFEPWPGELVLAAARHHNVRLITRVVDYGGLFHDDAASDRTAGSARRARSWISCGRTPSATGSRRCSSRAPGTSRSSRWRASRQRSSRSAARRRARSRTSTPSSPPCACRRRSAPPRCRQSARSATTAAA
jgi:aryl-alcohol dehydrogenase-like predicted oxidoreductase